ncbi:MAG: hypothetical protein ACTSR8_10240 [Promethearchaeota archaeon]
MQSQELKVFKIFYSGEISEIESMDLLELFSLLNVLAFYTAQQKRLYIWVGEHASSTLKNYIVRFRQIFTDDYPEYRVLRYITIESLTEPFDFFQNTGISKEDLHAKLEAEDAKYKEHEETISKINNLKDDADTAFENEDYDKAIEIAKQIVELAKSIEDDIILKDQNDFIAEAEARGKAKAVLKEIRKGKKELKQKFKNIKNNNDIIEIYNESRDYKQKFNDYLDLSALSEVKDLLKKIETTYNELQGNIEGTKQFNDFLTTINRIRESSKEALKKGNLIACYNDFKEIIKFLTERSS